MYKCTQCICTYKYMMEYTKAHTHIYTHIYIYILDTIYMTCLYVAPTSTPAPIRIDVL